MPNITGKTGRFAGRYEDGTGALRTVDYGQSSGTRDEQWNSSRITFDASLSNPIYGKSSTVTPASTTLYPWVVAYTAAIPASTAQATEFQQGLSGKADTNLGNTTPSQSFKEMSVGWGIPDYSAGVTISANTNFTCPAKGVIAGEVSAAQNGSCTIKINDILVEQIGSESGQRCRGPFYAQVKNGDVVYLLTSGNASIILSNFYPDTGVN